MVQSTLLNYINSGSIIDLLLIFSVYVLNWWIVINFGLHLGGSKTTGNIYAVLYMSGFCLVTKAYLPFIAYSFLATFTVILLFYLVSRLSWIRSIVIIVTLNLLAGIGDFLSGLLILKFTGKLHSAMETSTGICIGTISECLIPLILLITTRKIDLFGKLGRPILWMESGMNAWVQRNNKLFENYLKKYWMKLRKYVKNFRVFR
jgi:hypothetical protein